jgi:hypothetical protein
LSECGVEVAQDVQNLEQSILTGRGEVDFVRVTGGGPGVWLLGGLSYDHTNYCESFLRRELFPEMPEKPHEMISLVKMTTRSAPAP